MGMPVKNTAFPNFMFGPLTNSTNHQPQSGQAAYLSMWYCVDGGSWAQLSGVTFTDLYALENGAYACGAGWYSVTLPAAVLNGNNVIIQVVNGAGGSDPLLLHLLPN